MKTGQEIMTQLILEANKYQAITQKNTDDIKIMLSYYDHFTLFKHLTKEMKPRPCYNNQVFQLFGFDVHYLNGLEVGVFLIALKP